MLSNMLLGSWARMLDLLTPKELLNIAIIASTKCLKNGQIDGIAVSVGSPWSESKIQPNLSKELA